MSKHQEFFQDQFAYRVAKAEFTAEEGSSPGKKKRSYRIHVSDSLEVTQLSETGVSGVFQRLVSPETKGGMEIRVQMEFALRFLKNVSPTPQQDGEFWCGYICENGRGFTTVLCRIASNLISNLSTLCGNELPIITQPCLISGEKAKNE